MTQKFEFTIDGRPVSVALDNEETPLLNVLRNNLGVMGTRFGCAGSMRLLHGADRRRTGEELLETGCDVAGKAVITVEGLGTPERPHSLQQAFIDEQAGQCGYCLAGILISAKALLDRNPQPTRSEIAEALDGNICRCGAHNRIMRAIEKAAARLRMATNAGARP